MTDTIEVTVDCAKHIAVQMEEDIVKMRARLDGLKVEKRCLEGALTEIKTAMQTPITTFRSSQASARIDDSRARTKIIVECETMMHSRHKLELAVALALSAVSRVEFEVSSMDEQEAKAKLESINQESYSHKLETLMKPL